MHVESIVLNQSMASTARERKGATRRGNIHSSLGLQGARLLKAVIEFISKSRSLSSVVIDSVSLGPSLLLALGHALSHSCLCELVFRDVRLGYEGLRLLSPHLASCRAELMTFERCGLTDNCLLFLCSIVKAHDSFLDSLYWNSTLRRDSACDGAASLLTSAPPGGLAALDLSHNLLTLKPGHAGTEAMLSCMQQNQWLLGMLFY